MSINPGGEIQVFTRREFITDIKSATTQGGFRTARIPCNPNTTTFPFLSQLGTSYEHYQFADLTFYWRPITNENTTTAQVSIGTVTFYFCYDALEPIVLSRNEANNYQGARTARICDPLTFKVRVPNHPMFLRSAGTQTIDTDIRESDFGYLAVCTENVNTPEIKLNQPIGELWVTYKVAFWKPKIQDFIGAAVLQSSFIGKFEGNGVDGTTILGTAGTTFGCNPANRNFLIDNFGLKQSIVPATAPFNNCIAIAVRRGQVFEMKIRITLTSGSLGGGSYPLAVCLVPSDANVAGGQLNSAINAGSGACILTGYYPLADQSSVVTSYENQQLNPANATITSQCTARYVWKCTSDGTANFRIDNNGLTHGAAAGVGNFEFAMVLINRPDYSLQLPFAQRPPNWNNPNN